jgi:hypothetical protein
MNTDQTLMIANLIRLGVFAMNTAGKLNAGEMTPEEVEAEWEALDKHLSTAWDRWDAAGQPYV